jgi:hypothetical protein
MHVAPFIAALVVLVLALVAAVFLIRRQLEQKRSDALRVACDEVGFAFEADGEVQGGNVGIYRAAKRCEPENVRAFVVESQAVLRALTRR